MGFQQEHILFGGSEENPFSCLCLFLQAAFIPGIVAPYHSDLYSLVTSLLWLWPSYFLFIKALFLLWIKTENPVSPYLKIIYLITSAECLLPRKVTSSQVSGIRCSRNLWGISLECSVYNNCAHIMTKWVYLRIKMRVQHLKINVVYLISRIKEKIYMATPMHAHIQFDRSQNHSWFNKKKKSSQHTMKRGKKEFLNLIKSMYYEKLNGEMLNVFLLNH